MSEKIEVQNINSPTYIHNVDRAKYMAMRDAVMAVLPDSEPGATPGDIIAAVKPLLPQDLFPGGEKSGWWVKCVQLDLEARHVIVRAPGPPVRLRKV